MAAVLQKGAMRRLPNRNSYTEVAVKRQTQELSPLPEAFCCGRISWAHLESSISVSSNVGSLPRLGAGEQTGFVIC
jgi:hypothetical protein